MPKVFVVNKGFHEYQEATKWGELAYLTEGKSNIFASDNTKTQIETALKKATAEDYLLPSGHIIPNALAIHYLLSKYKQVKLLAWIGNLGKYQVITIRDRINQQELEPQELDPNGASPLHP